MCHLSPVVGKLTGIEFGRISLKRLCHGFTGLKLLNHLPKRGGFLGRTSATSHQRMKPLVTTQNRISWMRYQSKGKSQKFRKLATPFISGRKWEKISPFGQSGEKVSLCDSYIKNSWACLQFSGSPLDKKKVMLNWRKCEQDFVFDWQTLMWPSIIIDDVF